jgi:hypothetical protein
MANSSTHLTRLRFVYLFLFIAPPACFPCFHPLFPFLLFSFSFSFLFLSSPFSPFFSFFLLNLLHLNLIIHSPFYLIPHLSQAVSSQKELESVRKSCEVLREENDVLSSNLLISNTTLRQLQEEKDELEEVISKKATECNTASSNLSDQIQENTRLNELLQSGSTVSSSKMEALTTELEGYKVTIQEHKNELNTARVDAINMQEKLSNMHIQVTDLERDKAAILMKLEDTVGILEESTTVTIEKATSRLQDSDRKLKLADEKYLIIEKNLFKVQVSRCALLHLVHFSHMLTFISSSFSSSSLLFSIFSLSFLLCPFPHLRSLHSSVPSLTYTTHTGAPHCF